MKRCEKCRKKKKHIHGDRCGPCNLERGLKWCGRCETLLPAALAFYESQGIYHSPCRTCVSTGNKTGRAKGRPCVLSPQQAARAIDLYSSGQSIALVSHALGTNTGVIHRLLHRSAIKTRSSSHKAYALNHEFFSTIDTPEKAYWLGFLSADGNVSGTRVQINLKDREHLEKFKAAVGSTAPVKRYFKGSYELFKIAFRSKRMVEDLARYTVGPRKSFSVQPWHGATELLPHYWRGCVDGDGWVGDQLGFCGNRQMVEAFAQYFGVSHSPYHNIFRAWIYGKKKFLAMRVMDWSQQPALERKARYVLEALEEVRARPG